jgi:hypothetical protein
MIAQQMIKLKGSGRRPTGHSLLFMLLVVIIVPTLRSSVRADGGVVLLRRTAGPFTVTAFSAETPLRAGPADISVMIEDARDPGPVLGARVFIEFKHEAGATVTAEATHGQARNKLLYCSLINLPEPGRWKMKVAVSHAGESAEALGALTVVEPQPVLWTYGELIAFPPIIIFLFVINQWLRRHGSLRR